jgi:hypothetical protein
MDFHIITLESKISINAAGALEKVNHARFFACHHDSSQLDKGTVTADKPRIWPCVIVFVPDFAIICFCKVTVSACLGLVISQHQVKRHFKASGLLAESSKERFLNCCLFAALLPDLQVSLIINSTTQ